MNTEGKKFHIHIPSAQDTQIAGKVSTWTEQAGNMLPKPVEEVVKLFAGSNSVVLLDGSDVISHAAITYEYPDDQKPAVEIGALFTDPEHRGKGAGTQAVKEIVLYAAQKHPDTTIFALANENSAPLFKKMGAKEMNPVELPQKVWEPCESCPRNPQKSGECEIFKCCDTPYNLSPILDA